MSSATNVPRMDDASLALALRDGDPEAFARIYDTFADRLFTYAITLVRDRDTAADVVHDTFLLAHDRIAQLRDPSRLRPWLYAITRSQALRVLRQGGRDAGLDSVIDVTDQEVRLDRSLDADEARVLVTAALAGLNVGDREVIELSLRHELDTASIASAMGQTSSHASALVSRAKKQFDTSLSAVLLMRTRGRDCDALRSLIGSEDALTPLLRKRIGRHVGECDDCTRNRRAAIAVLPGLAMALPFQGAPESVRDGVVGTNGGLNDAVEPRLVDGAPPTLGPDGFPVTESLMRRRWIIAAVVAGMLALLMVGLIGNRVLGTREGPVAAPVTTTPAATPDASATPRPTTGSESTPPTPRPTPASTTGGDAQGGGVAVAPPPQPTTPAQPRPTNSAKPSAPPVPPPATPSVGVSWSDLDPSTCLPTFDIRVTATITGASVSKVTATWRATSGSGSGSVTLVRTSNQQWQGVLSSIPSAAQPSLSVRVVTPQGVTVNSPSKPVTDGCGG